MRHSRVEFVAALFVIVFSLTLLPLTASAASANDVLAQARQLEATGQFKVAAQILRSAMADHSTPDPHRKLEFELDRLDRIRLDYSLTEDSLFAELQQSVRNLTRNEFEQWIKQGRFDYRLIDGQQQFMHSSVSNLFFRYPELEARRLGAEDNSAVEKSVLASCRAIKQAAAAQNEPYVLPKRFDVTMTVTADADAAPSGQIICAWLPLPRSYRYQNDIQVIGGSPAPKEIAPGSSPIRSAYFEQPAQAGVPTIFQLHYRFTHFGVHCDIDTNKVTSFNGQDPAIAPFVREAPHVVFTPQMRALSAQIVGNEKNPSRIAKKIYDWIGTNIHYSFATEYSTIDNISDYVLTHRYGDCGEESLFFITLCRLNNIPARWQSGWDIFPGKEDIHDWSEIYLAPYGWIPVDPCMGLLSEQYMTTLSRPERLELHNFYFGGLDEYRMAANANHSQLLTPPKNSFRSDNVDFQRGELESYNQDIYFNHYSYRWSIHQISK